MKTEEKIKERIDSLYKQREEYESDTFEFIRLTGLIGVLRWVLEG